MKITTYHGTSDALFQLDIVKGRYDEFEHEVLGKEQKNIEFQQNYEEDLIHEVSPLWWSKIVKEIKIWMQN